MSFPSLLTKINTNASFSSRPIPSPHYRLPAFYISSTQAISILIFLDHLNPIPQSESLDLFCHEVMPYYLWQAMSIIVVQ
jgi:hypothetical protein